MTLFASSLIVIFGLIFLLGLISSAITDRLPLSEPMLALFVGAVLGLTYSGPLSISPTPISRTFFHGLAEITLAIALMTTALQVPHHYMRTHWKRVVILLGVGMPLMWVVSGAAIYLIMGVPLGAAALIGAILTPTDPVLASTIVTGRLAEANITARIRQILIVESGINDGLAYVFVLLPFNLLDAYGAHPLRSWLIYSVLWEVCGSIVFGLVIGLVGGFATNLAIKREYMEHASFLGLTLALALATLGILNGIGTDGVLGVFAAGLAFSETLNLEGHELERTEHVQEAVERFFDLPVFIVLGAVLPWHAWIAMGWSAVGIAAVILLFRRIPVILGLVPLLRPTIANWREAAFIGWFGPVGISALFYATLTFPTTRDGTSLSSIWPIVTLIITASVIAHGASATTLTKLFGRVSGAMANRQSQTQREQQQTNAIDEIEQQVRQQVHAATLGSISSIIQSHIAAVKAHKGEDDPPGPLQLACVPETASGRYGPEVGSRSEQGQKLANDIAHDVADALAEQAASTIRERLSSEQDNSDDEQDHRDHEHQEEELNHIDHAQGGSRS